MILFSDLFSVVVGKHLPFWGYRGDERYLSLVFIVLHINLKKPTIIMMSYFSNGMGRLLVD